MKENYCEQLNAFAKSLGVSDRITFYGEDFCAAITSVAPFSRVAVLYSKNTFETVGKDFTVSLKNAGVKPLNFIMPTDVTVKLDDILEVICVPEDVRAIACLDSSLIPVSAYLATIFNIPVVFSMRSANTDGVLPVKVPFSFGSSGAEMVKTACNYHISVDFDNFKNENLAQAYINIVSKRVALADYRANIKVYGKKAQKTVCDETLSAIDAICNYPDALDAKVLAFYGLKAEIANLAVNDEIRCNSAFHCFKMLTAFSEDNGQNFAFLQKLTLLYKLCAENADMPFAVPDYNARVKELSFITGLDDGVFLRGFTAQNKVLKSADLTQIKSALKKEISAAYSAIKKAEKTYADLGGKICEDFSPYVSALKYCGDLPDALNFMTIVRECGFTESFSISA